MKSADFNSLNIKQFRGLKNYEFTNFSNVNVFVGENNAGKTSVLESIQLLSNPGSGRLIRRVALQRERYRVFGIRSYYPTDYVKWLFPNNGSVEPILINYEIKEKKDFLKLDLNENKLYYSEDYLSEEEIYFGEEEETEIELNIHVKTSKFDEDVIIQNRYMFNQENINKDQKINFKVNYISAVEHKVAPVSSVAIGELILNNEKDEFIKMIRLFNCDIETIEIVPRNIRLSGEKNRSRVENAIFIRSKKDNNLKPIFVFGDGLQKVMIIASKIINSRNGLILIDEAETGIHTKMLPVYFNWLVKLAHENNVQLFITTHSLEAVDAILGSEMEQKDLSFYRLDNDRVKYFSGEKMHKLRFEFGQDVRYS